MVGHHVENVHGAMTFFPWCKVFHPSSNVIGRDLHCDVQVGAYTAEAFDHFIAALLTKMNHFPQQNSILVMDNTSIHKSVQLAQMCEDR